jgi:hypothetical protein
VPASPDTPRSPAGPAPTPCRDASHERTWVGPQPYCVACAPADAPPETPRTLDQPCPDCGLPQTDATHDDADTCIRLLRSEVATLSARLSTQVADYHELGSRVDRVIGAWNAAGTNASQRLLDAMTDLAAARVALASAPTGETK